MVQRPAGRASLADVRQHLLACAPGPAAPFAAVMRLADGTPKLLTRPALDALCARLETQAAGGERGDPAHTPVLLQVRARAAGSSGGAGLRRGRCQHAALLCCAQPLSRASNGRAATLPNPAAPQAYVPPALDLRLVTTYTNDGAAVACHTFQRRYSRRYLPLRLPPAATDALPAAEPAAAAAGEAAPQGGDQQGGEDKEQGGGEEQGEPPAEVVLDEGALADSERQLAATLGPLDPSLKMAARKTAHALVGAHRRGGLPPAWFCCVVWAGHRRVRGCSSSHTAAGELLAVPCSGRLSRFPPRPCPRTAPRAPQVQYVQKAHLLTLRGLVCEFVRGGEGHLWLLGPLRADWASLIPGAWAQRWR